MLIGACDPSLLGQIDALHRAKRSARNAARWCNAFDIDLTRPSSLASRHRHHSMPCGRHDAARACPQPPRKARCFVLNGARSGGGCCARLGAHLMQVYQYDRVGASGLTYHKKCFRCYHCNKVMSQSHYHVSSDRHFRCAAHHREYEMQQL